MFSLELSLYKNSELDCTRTNKDRSYGEKKENNKTKMVNVILYFWIQPDHKLLACWMLNMVMLMVLCFHSFLHVLKMIFCPLNICGFAIQKSRLRLHKELHLVNPICEKLRNIAQNNTQNAIGELYMQNATIRTHSNLIFEEQNFTRIYCILHSSIYAVLSAHCSYTGCTHTKYRIV